MSTKKRTSRRASSRRGKSRSGNASRIVQGTYNPGMNPFQPPPELRFSSQWKLGDAGAVYEFYAKIMRIEADISEDDWEHEARMAFKEFEQKLRKKYPWVGRVYFTGRSGGWIAVDDPQGKMTESRLLAISKMVQSALAQFKKDIVRAYPRRSKR